MKRVLELEYRNEIIAPIIKYNESTELTNQKEAISISNHRELTSTIDYFNTFDKEIATDNIYTNLGATRSIIEHI